MGQFVRLLWEGPYAGWINCGTDDANLLEQWVVSFTMSQSGRNVNHSETTLDNW